VHTLRGHTDWLRAVAISSNGELAVSGSHDASVRVWDLASGTQLQTLSGHADWVISVEVYQSGERAISTSRDGTVRVWDLDGGNPIATFSADGSVGPCVIAGTELSPGMNWGSSTSYS
jgi:WD40 repeat protein